MGAFNATEPVLVLESSNSSPKKPNVCTTENGKAYGVDNKIRLLLPYYI